VQTDVGAHLRNRVTRGTQPEIRLRRAVHALGLRFRLNRRIGRFAPDLVLPRHRLAVFVDGCYWHNCPEHGPKLFRGPNAEKWHRKISANESRDLAAIQALSKAGWRVVRIWECEIRTNVDQAARRVVVATQTGSAAAAASAGAV
jgi:DNA mismatch endonuclease (patch repair protein)